jgi:hypothetical protein
MSSGREGICHMTILEKDRGLTVTHDQLRAQFEIRRAFLREPVDHFVTGLIQPFDDFDKQ